MFFSGINPSLHFCIDAKFNILDFDRANPSREDLKWHHISAALPCQNIAKMVRVMEPEPTQTQDEKEEDGHHYRELAECRQAEFFEGTKACWFWEEYHFRNLRRRGRLNLEGDSRMEARRSFMYNMTQLEAEFPYFISSFN